MIKVEPYLLRRRPITLLKSRHMVILSCRCLTIPIPSQQVMLCWIARVQTIWGSISFKNATLATVQELAFGVLSVKFWIQAPVSDIVGIVDIVANGWKWLNHDLTIIFALFNRDCFMALYIRLVVCCIVEIRVSTVGVINSWLDSFFDFLLLFLQFGF